jgi:hypothetical protein
MSNAEYVSELETGADELWNNLCRAIYDQVAPGIIKDVTDDIYYSTGLSEVVDDIIVRLT